MGQPVPTLSHESRFRLSPLKSHLRNHGGSGVKVHSAGNLRVPQSPPRCRNPAKVEEGCEKDFSTSRHTHTHTHMAVAFRRENTNRDEFRPAGPRCTAAEATEKGGEQVMARCCSVLVYILAVGRVAPGSTPRGQLHLSMRRGEQPRAAASQSTPFLPFRSVRESGNPVASLPPVRWRRNTEAVTACRARARYSRVCGPGVV